MKRKQMKEIQQLATHAPDAAPPKIDGRLNSAVTRVSNAPLRAGNSLQLLRNGPETYDDWLRAIGQAQRWVHFENYIFKDDTIGQRFAEALLERASAGVQVRVLYDWFGSLDVSRSFWRNLRQGGVDVRVVNPIGFGAPWEVVQRDHRKFLAVDGVYGSVGGVCVADPWLEHSPVTGLPYRDTAVNVTGPIIADFEQAFANVWKENGAPLPSDELPKSTDIAPTGSISARVIAEEPGRLRMLRMLQVVLAGVEQRLWISDAYFLAIPLLREALIAAARDGVDVRILLPSTNDLPLVGAFSRYGYRPLLESGVQIWEYAGLMMHAKTTVADGWWSRIGSTNLNVTGLVTNWEIDLVAEDRDFGAAMEDMYEDDLANAREVRLSGRRRTQPRPQRPESRAERHARRDMPHGSARTNATVARVGAAALSAVGSDTLQQHERSVSLAISTSLLGFGLLTLRFPRVLAWPIGFLSAVFGGASLVRALRSPHDKPAHKPSDNESAPPAFRHRRGRFGAFTRKRRQRA
jgi:cardiolipin synthase